MHECVGRQDEMVARWPPREVSRTGSGLLDGVLYRRRGKCVPFEG